MQRVQPRRDRRSAFTLVELLVVVAILGILAAVIIPAVTGTMRRAEDAQVRTEIGQLDTAFSNFKADFGKYPPSRIEISNPATPATMNVLRGIWPQIRNYAVENLYDRLGAKDPFILRGDECLVFFLAGPEQKGFSKNPRDPFETVGGNRVPPFYEFDSARLSDSTDSTLIQAGVEQQFKVFRSAYPSQVKPYIFFSSYNGRGYRDDDNTEMNAYYLDAAGDKPYKPSSVQIICPGRDESYGVGGHYDVSGDRPVLKTGTSIKKEEGRDNLTNFAQSKLVP